MNLETSELTRTRAIGIPSTINPSGPNHGPFRKCRVDLGLIDDFFLAAPAPTGGGTRTSVGVFTKVLDTGSPAVSKGPRGLARGWLLASTAVVNWSWAFDP